MVSLCGGADDNEPRQPGAIVIQTGLSSSVETQHQSAREPFTQPPVGRPTAGYIAVPGHEEALARLLYLAERGRSCGLMVGPHGAGKSLLFSEAARELRNGQRCVIAIDMSCLNADALMDRVLFAAGLPRTEANASQNEQRLRDFFQGQQLVGHPVVLLADHVDEADDCGLKALDRIIRLADRSLGSITLLAAANDIDRALRFDWLARNNELRIDLPPLNRSDVADYLSAAMEMAKCECRFSDESIDLIADRSAGLPAAINRLARLAVLAAQSEGEPVVSGSLIETVDNELPTRVG